MEHSDLWCELHLQKRSVIWSNDQSAFVSEATGRQYRLSILLSSNSPTKFPEGIMNVGSYNMEQPKFYSKWYAQQQRNSSWKLQGPVLCICKAKAFWVSSY